MHKKFKDIDLHEILDKQGVIYDVKGILPKNIIDGRL